MPDLPGGENVGADILQKRGIEGGGLLACQRRNKSGLGAARRGSFCHDRDATRLDAEGLAGGNPGLCRIHPVPRAPSTTRTRFADVG